MNRLPCRPAGVSSAARPSPAPALPRARVRATRPRRPCGPLRALAGAAWLPRAPWALSLRSAGRGLAALAAAVLLGGPGPAGWGQDPGGPAGPGDPGADGWLEWDAVAGVHRFRWWARAGWSYFVQRSPDLATWAYEPLIARGADGVEEWAVAPAGDRLFLRVLAVQQTAADQGALEAADFDGDGTGNRAELQAGTDPLDYYNGRTPRLETVAGEGQTAEPDGRFPQPLRVRVVGPDGRPLANAPVTFSIQTGEGWLVPADGSCRTGSDGVAEARCETAPGRGAAAVVVAASATPGGAAAAGVALDLAGPAASLAGSLDAWVVGRHRVALEWSGLNVSSCLLERRDGLAGEWVAEHIVTGTGCGEWLSAIPCASAEVWYRLRSLNREGTPIAAAVRAAPHPLPGRLLGMPMESCPGRFNGAGQFAFVEVGGRTARAWDGQRWQTLPGAGEGPKTLGGIAENGDLAGSVNNRATVWKWDPPARGYAAAAPVPGLDAFAESYGADYLADGSLAGVAATIEHRPVYRTVHHVHPLRWTGDGWQELDDLGEQPTREQIWAAIGLAPTVYEYSYRWDSDAGWGTFGFWNPATGEFSVALPADAGGVWVSGENATLPDSPGVAVGTARDRPETAPTGETYEVRHYSYFLCAPDLSATSTRADHPYSESWENRVLARNDRGDALVRGADGAWRLELAGGGPVGLGDLPSPYPHYQAGLSHYREVCGGAFAPDGENYMFCQPFTRFADDTAGDANQLLAVPEEHADEGGAAFCVNRFGYAGGAFGLGEGGGLIGAVAALWRPDGALLDLHAMLFGNGISWWPWLPPRAISINDAGLILCASDDPVGDNPSRKRLLLPFDMAVDANRDGAVDFAGNPTAAAAAPEQTEWERPFRFWINNDQDQHWRNDLEEPGLVEGDVVPVEEPDAADGLIASQRDLEDFAQLGIYIGAFHDALRSGAIQLGFEWQDATGSPGVRIFPNWCDPPDAYLKDAAQAAWDLGVEPVATVPGTAIVPAQHWVDSALGEDNPCGHFIFEGVSEGWGRLAITLRQADGTKIADGPGVWLELKDIRRMYQRGDSATAHPWEAVAFEPDPAEARQVIVFVHGWRMSPQSAGNYAETMYKRLWHRGFKGRFAAFHWDTWWCDAAGWVPWLGGAIDAYLARYNDSENIAWRAAPALRDFVNGLPADYARNMVAHSMGNIVAGEALRQGLDAANYALLQAAVPAACYDDADSVRCTDQYEHSAWPLRFTMWDNVTPDGDPGPETRQLAYRGRLQNIPGNLVNFFQPEDYATSYAWEINNDQTKPEGGAFAANFHYAPDNPDGQRLYKYQLVPLPVPPGGTVELLDHYLEDPFEAMPYACHTWGKAAGAWGPTAGKLDPANAVNLGSATYQLPDQSKTGFGEDHSAEFNARIQDLKAFYDTLLDKLRVPRNP